ncbi:hypothetical protein CAC42_3350 [Sphaceloma murrayae]|uniref:Copper acquisition factor BIM1-like domain-containing protein n=1 Tax=Sphaceloma murrayae TaxID=2082308 RepID=A0A2K1R1E7_9PEZI|nr:hypothetical protein CAC42_3350 [Sphaceloma murrayae]
MRSTSVSTLLLIVSAVGVQGQDEPHGSEAAKTMGPAAFMWPPDREWGAAQDNTAPCGSTAGVTNRTDFPLVNGQVALVMQDDSYYVQVGIAYNNDPRTMEDFQVVIDDARLTELDPGHSCFPVPDPPSGTVAGSNATLQIRYTSDFETDRNETFYACSDIRYVLTTDFNYQVPCFNASVDDFDVPAATATPSGGNAASATSSPTGAAVSAQTSTAAVSGGGSGVSGGAIAGIVVGAIAGVALIAGALFLWRRKQQKKRIAMIAQSSRHVAWDGSGENRKQSSSSKDTDTSIQLRNLDGK